VAMWFPQQERAFATGLFNSGTNVGVMLSFVTVWLATTFGWQTAFIAIGVVGFFWLAFWWRAFDAPEKHPRVSPEELNYIQSGRPPTEETIKLPWTSLLRYREVWPFLIGKMLTDPVWWFYLFWLPSYLERERGQNPLKSALLLAVIYTGSSIGSIAGGYLSGFLIRRGWQVGSARMVTMLGCAVCMPGSIIAYYTDSFALCVAFITLATACHQAWSANLYTVASDLFPSKLSGSVVGLGATTGGIGGMFMTLLAALAIQWTGNQQTVFITMGLLHPLALLIFWLVLRGRFEQVDLARLPNMMGADRALIIAGSAIAVAGAFLLTLITLNWELCVQAATPAGAAQAATAAGGVCLVGLAILYAGSPRRQVA
jgi:ACS family hexuronate transporter-like MFS transporter